MSKRIRPAPFVEISHKDPIINRIQSNVQKAFAPLQDLAALLDDSIKLTTTVADNVRVIVAINPSNGQLFVKEDS